MESLTLPSSRLSSHLVFGFMIALAGLTTSCTSANMKPLQSPFSGNTNVTLLLTSTANDQLVQFDID